MSADIKLFEAGEWAERAATLIQDRIDAVLSVRGRCSVMLTGGRSAERLYSAWAELPAFWRMKGVDFFFGDERCVPPAHVESNFGMVMKCLFKRGIPAGCSVFRMEADELDLEAASQRYAGLMPDEIDVLLLGVGEDGHIASLFPGGEALKENVKRVLSVTGTKPPYARLTITPPVIAKAEAIFVLAPGREKGLVLSKALQATGDFAILPACLVLNATWLLDTSADR